MVGIEIDSMHCIALAVWGKMQFSFVKHFRKEGIEMIRQIWQAQNYDGEFNG